MIHRSFIGANDTLIFRSSIPFNKKRHNNYAKLGDITPRPFFGMIRSFLLLSLCNKQNIPVSKINNISKGNIKDIPDSIEKLLLDIGHPHISKNGIPNLEIKGIFIYDDKNEELFPFPKTLRLIENNKNEIIFDKIFPKERITKSLILKCNQDLKFNDNEAQNLILGTRIRNQFKRRPKFISKNGFIEFLCGNFDKIKISDLVFSHQIPYKVEQRIGIEIDKEKYTAEEHLLYRTENLRFIEDLHNKVGFVIWFNDENIIQYLNKIKSKKNEKISIGKLGGENNSIYIQRINSIEINKEFKYDKIFEKIEKNKQFFIYLATPAIFNSEDKINWKPPIELIEQFTGIKKEDLSFLGGILGKPSLIGGFNTVEKKEIPLKRAVPPGSVFFYKYNKGLINDSEDWPKNLSNQEYTHKEGFGLSFLGGY